MRCGTERGATCLCELHRSGCVPLAPGAGSAPRGTPHVPAASHGGPGGCSHSVPRPTSTPSAARRDCVPKPAPCGRWRKSDTTAAQVSRGTRPNLAMSRVRGQAVSPGATSEIVTPGISLFDMPRAVLGWASGQAFAGAFETRLQATSAPANQPPTQLLAARGCEEEPEEESPGEEFRCSAQSCQHRLSSQPLPVLRSHSLHSPGLLQLASVPQRCVIRSSGGRLPAVFAGLSRPARPGCVPAGEASWHAHARQAESPAAERSSATLPTLLGSFQAQARPRSSGAFLVAWLFSLPGVTSVAGTDAVVVHSQCKRSSTRTATQLFGDGRACTCVRDQYGRSRSGSCQQPGALKHVSQRANRGRAA